MFHQGKAACTGSGEADRRDARVFHQCFAERVTGPVEKRENALRQAAFFQRCGYGPGDQFGRAGMRRVPFHHDAAASRQSRGGVTPGDGKGEREIARTENCDRPERDLAHPQIGLWRCARWIGMVDPQSLPCAVFHFIGKQAKLADSAAPLPVQPRLGQAAFEHCPLRERVSQSIDLVGCKPEKCRAIFKRKGAEGGLRLCSSHTGIPEIGQACLGKSGLDRISAGGFDRVERCFAGAPVARNQIFASQH